MELSRLEDSVQRWLIHADYKFSKVRDEHRFSYAIEYESAPSGKIDIFHPRQNTTALVVGSMIPLNNYQNRTYLGLNKAEKERVTGRIEEYCNSINAISRFSMEDGKLVTRTYTVIDDEELMNQEGLIDAISTAAEMGNGVRDFLHRVF